MAENSGIQWTNHTWNPWRGCTKVSPGCDMCYAEAGAARFPKMLGVWGDEGTRVLAADAQWRLPHKWNRESAASKVPARVFTASIADVFEDWQHGLMDPHERPLRIHGQGRGIPLSDSQGGGRTYMMADARNRMFGTIKATPNLRYLLLTKRPQNMRWMMPTEYFDRDPVFFPDYTPTHHAHAYNHVWLGCTVEDNARARERIPELVKVPASVHFLSMEPLLEYVDIAPYLEKGGIQWVIVGGESSQGGQTARHFDLAWAEEIVAVCRRFEVPVFVKQLGSRPIAEGLGVLNRKGDRHGGSLEAWPEWLRVREVPAL